MTWYLTKRTKIYTYEKIASSINDAGKIGRPHEEEWNHHEQKLSQVDQRPQFKTKNAKLLEEIIGTIQ